VSSVLRLWTPDAIWHWMVVLIIHWFCYQTGWKSQHNIPRAPLGSVIAYVKVISEKFLCSATKYNISMVLKTEDPFCSSVVNTEPDWNLQYMRKCV
jgi:hypothetical protein